MRTRAALAIVLLTASGPALAQIGVGAGGQKPDEVKAPATPAPPPAIPGAAANPDAVIPAEKGVGEMSPNDALFDAVQRGDIAGAREALSRGAQVEAHNILGQTPLDVSVDLNRNDITFLLLSMRTPPATTPPDRLASASAAASPATPGNASSRHGRRTGHTASATLARSGGASTTAVSATRVASDGGTPKPDAGFLGFGR